MPAALSVLGYGTGILAATLLQIGIGLVIVPGRFERRRRVTARTALPMGNAAPILGAVFRA